MAAIEKKSLDSADETRKFQANGYMEVVKLSGMTFGRAVFEPGWKWSNDVKPIAGTNSCQTDHKGYIVSGRMVIKADDGTQIEVGPGDAFIATPGHDAWVVGEDPCIALDFTGAATYAK